MKCQIKDWFTEEYGFFGQFYYVSDNSSEGPYKGKGITRKERTNKEVQMIIDMLGVKAGDNLFDCPCGWGRHSIELAKKGINVTAIDLNRHYLGILNKNLEAETDITKSNITVVRSDMRNIVGSEQYDFGINMFSSFGFFDDPENYAVARNFYNMLKPGGKMMIHLDFNAERLENGFGFDYAPERNINYEGNRYFLKVEKEYHNDDKRLHGLWKLAKESEEPVEKMYSFRIYSSEEMTELLQKAGFRSVQFYSTNQTKQVFDDIDTVIIAEK